MRHFIGRGDKKTSKQIFLNSFDWYILGVLSNLIYIWGAMIMAFSNNISPSVAYFNTSFKITKMACMLDLGIFVHLAKYIVAIAQNTI